MRHVLEHVSRITLALTGPQPINIDLRNDAIGGSASNALLSELFVFWQGLAVPVYHREYPNLVVLHAVDNSKRVDEQFSTIGATVFWNYRSRFRKTLKLQRSCEYPFINRFSVRKRLIGNIVEYPKRILRSAVRPANYQVVPRPR